MPASDYITLQLDEHGNHDLLILKADDISAVRINPGNGRETPGRVAFSADHPHNLMGHAGEVMSLTGPPAGDFLGQWSKATGVKVPDEMIERFEAAPTAAPGSPPGTPPGTPAPAGAATAPSVDTLGLDPKVVAALKAEKYHTVADLHAASDEELDEIEGVGPATVKDIRSAVKKAGH